MKNPQKWFGAGVVLVGAGIAAALFLRVRAAAEEPLSQGHVAECLSDKGHIIIAKVTDGRITNPGTRSESAFYTLEVIDDLTGNLKGNISAGRYTGAGQHFLKRGESYLLCVFPGRAPGGSAHGLGRFETRTDESLETVKAWITEWKNGERDPTASEAAPSR